MLLIFGVAPVVHAILVLLIEGEAPYSRVDILLGIFQGYLVSCYGGSWGLVGGVRTQNPKPFIGLGCSPRFLVHVPLRRLASQLFPRG